MLDEKNAITLSSMSLSLGQQRDVALSVVWAGSDLDPYLSVHAKALLELGLVIATRSCEQTPLALADIRVLPSWSLPSAQLYGLEYRLDPRPTLLLARAEDDVDAMLDVARDSDEVGHAAESPATLVKRIRRLAGRADSYRRVGDAVDQDPLTGLWNRRRFCAELPQLLDKAPVSAGACALVLLDLDEFKKFNDQHGHTAGDELLRHSARAIRQALGPGDVAARYGGEEFAVLLCRADEAAVLEAVDAMRRRVGDRQSAVSGGAAEAMTTSASAGAAIYRSGLSLAECIRRADIALYEAKSQGRDRLVSYDSLEGESQINDPGLNVRHFQNVTRVVTERVASLISLMGRQVAGEIQRDANQDALTAVHNRRYFDNRIAREFELAAKDARKLTLAFVDIDNFGEFNRRFGAPTGDAVLRQFSAMVLSVIRPVDWLARYGGEEFCVVMPVSLGEGLAAAERLRAAIASTNMRSFDGQPVSITVSIGVAEHIDPLEIPAALIQRASKALQLAKQRGRDRVLAADP